MKLNNVKKIVCVMLSCILSGCSHTVVEHQFHIDTEYVTETEIRDEIDDVSAKLAQVAQQIKELKVQSDVTIVESLSRLPENDKIKTVSEDYLMYLEKPLEDKVNDLIEGNEMNEDRICITMVGIEFNLEDGAYGYMLAWMKCLIKAYEVILAIPKDDLYNLQNAVIDINGSNDTTCYKVGDNETAKYYKVVRIRLYKQHNENNVKLEAT